MAGIAKADVLAALGAVAAPGGGDLVGNGLVSDVVVADGKVTFSIAVAPQRAADMEPVRRRAEAAVLGVPGVQQAVVMLTAERPRAGAGDPGNAPPAAPNRPTAGPPAPKAGIPGVAAIIAVASGKGGVGKSTTAVNLALGLQALGLTVGLLDADIYGPSVPRLLGLSGKPETRDGRTILPMQRYGLKVMSMGFLVDEEAPMIWRGPMVMSALTQLLRDVAWAPLDVLVVDMPPGTGDAQLTLSQQTPLAGAVIVSTPQDIALIDARKGLNMFRKVGVPVLGIVENMSYFIAPDTGRRYHIFGHGGAEREAARLGVPFLGAVPLEIAIREQSDAGAPVTASDPAGPHSLVYREIAGRVRDAITGGAIAGRRAPRIVVED